jgi:hypothetical protein
LRFCAAVAAFFSFFWRFLSFFSCFFWIWLLCCLDVFSLDDYSVSKFDGKASIIYKQQSVARTTGKII